MCGIAGIFEPERRPETPPLVARMLSRIAHRGPDGEGIVADDRPVDRAVLGHRRLAIFDLTDAARQPMAREGERWWIVYNGAIYNAPELRAELESRGERFVTRSDTEVLLASWIRWGPAALPRLNGMWAFAIWDRAERKLVCCRDRYGVKPLYWARDAGGRFAFASEPKALRPFLAAEPDDEIVRSFFRTGLSVGSGDRTIYRNYRCLSEGSILEVSAKGEKESRWYVPPEPRPFESRSRAARTAREEFFPLLRDAVRIRLRSDAPVGVFLSGGMDSSSILAASAALEARERGGFAGKTISLAYPDAPEIDESGYARAMARRANCAPEFVEPDGARLEAEMDELAWTLDDLTFHHGFYAMKLLSARAREAGIRVVLTGQGGDELLGGYEPWDVHLRELWSGGRRLRAIGEAFLSGRRFWGAARALRRLPGNLRAARSSRPLDAFCSARPTLQGHLRHQFLLDRLPFVLRFEDRVTMAHGVESRQPFLDHRVVEFLWRAPGDWLLRDGQTKWLLRRAMKARLPGEILRRPSKLATPGPRRRFSAEAVERARAAYRRFIAKGWLDAAGPSESDMIDSEYALFRLLIAEAWSRRCLGADAG